MALRTWARLVSRHSAALPNSDECRCSAMAARRFLRARRRSAMRWRASARFRAWTDFVLTLQKYHAFRSRKAGTWELLSFNAETQRNAEKRREEPLCQSLRLRVKPFAAREQSGILQCVEH